MRGRLWIGALIVALGVAVAHGGALSAEFVSFDDDIYVYGNPNVLAGLSADSAAWAFKLDGRQFYFHPLTWLSLMADRELLGPKPWGFHLVNVALHVATVVLLFVGLARATGRPGVALAAALLYGVHPLTVEAVAWVTERKSVLSGALAVSSVLVYGAYARRPSGWRLAAAAGLHLASVLAKPSLVVLPALLLVLDWWPLGRLREGGEARTGEAPRLPLRGLLVEKIPFVLISAGATAVTLLSIRGLPGPGTGASPLGLRVANALATLPRYLGAAVWPRALSVLHPFPAEVAPAAALAGAALVASLGLLALATARSRPWLVAGWAWFLVALAPHLGLKQAGLWPAWADRFTYVALAGLAAAVAFEGAELARRLRIPRGVTVAAAACAIVALGAATRAQGAFWRNSLALFQHAVEIEPSSAVMQYNLGTELAKAGRLDEAAVHLETALRIEPAYASAQSQFGSILKLRGRLEEAGVHYREALRLEPDQPEALFNYAEVLRATGRLAEAKPLYARFLQVAPPQFAPQRAAAGYLLGR